MITIIIELFSALITACRASEGCSRYLHPVIRNIASIMLLLPTVGDGVAAAMETPPGFCGRTLTRREECSLFFLVFPLNHPSPQQNFPIRKPVVVGVLAGTTWMLFFYPAFLRQKLGNTLFSVFVHDNCREICKSAGGNRFLIEFPARKVCYVKIKWETNGLIASPFSFSLPEGVFETVWTNHARDDQSSWGSIGGKHVHVCSGASSIWMGFCAKIKQIFNGFESG